MADVHDKKTRSYNMSRIRGRNTKPELFIRKLCHSLGLRFRLYDKNLPGKPDLVFKRHNTVIFVHGCFWHMHNCKYGEVVPKTNAEIWREKRLRTVERDKENLKNIVSQGWRPVTIWECETKDKSRLTKKLNAFLS